MMRMLRFGRKSVIVFVVALLVAGCVHSGATGGPALAPNADNGIVKENRAAGTSTWKLRKWNPKVIEGYASAMSILPGDTMDLFVSTTSHKFTLEVYRLGWYGGEGGARKLTVGSIMGSYQPACNKDTASGLVSCPWKKSYSLAIPANWITGVYLAKVRADSGEEAGIPFVVQGTMRGRIAAIMPFFTYQAYNHFQGEDLYSSEIPGKTFANRVSFDRPFMKDAIGPVFDTELASIQFLESRGYPVSYISDLDLHATNLTQAKPTAMISLGHDEYWTSEMRQHADEAVSDGIHLAVWGANSGYWRVRLEPNNAGVPDRVLVCYKGTKDDPTARTSPGEATVKFRDAPLNLPESNLFGVMYSGVVKQRLEAPATVEADSHWIFEGTALKKGDSIPKVVGIEADSLAATPVPALTVLLSSTFEDRSGGQGMSHTTIYQHRSGAWVFAAGSITWARLVSPRGSNRNAAVERMMENMLNRWFSVTKTAS